MVLLFAEFAHMKLTHARRGAPVNRARIVSWLKLSECVKLSSIADVFLNLEALQVLLCVTPLHARALDGAKVRCGVALDALRWDVRAAFQQAEFALPAELHLREAASSATPRVERQRMHGGTLGRRSEVDGVDRRQRTGDFDR